MTAIDISAAGINTRIVPIHNNVQPICVCTAYNGNRFVAYSAGPHAHIRTQPQMREIY